MNYQSKKLVNDSIYKAIKSAPSQNIQNGYAYNTNSAKDISYQVFITWVNYVYQILDISYDYIRFDFILSTRNRIFQLVNQYGIPYIHIVSQINNELFNLTQMILQY